MDLESFPKVLHFTIFLYSLCISFHIDGPIFQSNMTGQLNITEHNNASFLCIVEGFPQPSIAWRKNGDILQTDSYKTIKIISSKNKVVMRSILDFTKVVDNDTAVYTCEAQSIVGTKHQSKKLNVQCKYLTE